MIPLAVALLLLTAAIAGWLRHRYLIVTVRGDSMLPTLRDGDVLLARRRAPADIRVGEVVVAAWLSAVDSPEWMVKRVAAVPGDRVPDGVRNAADGGGAEVAAAVAGAVKAPETVPPGAFIVFGDNGGYDSRVFGLLAADRVRAVLVRTLRTARG